MMKKQTAEKNSLFLLVTATAIFLICFAIVANFVISGRIQAFDDIVRFYIYDHRTDFLDSFFMFVTFFGNPEFIIGFCIVSLFLKATRTRCGLQISSCALASDLLNKLFKNTIQRARPEAAVAFITETSFSFPSGHSMTGLVFYGVLIYCIRRNFKNRKAANILTAVLSLLIFLIGFSRIYIGVHFPSDVIGGWCIGSAVLCVSILILSKLHRKNRGL